MNTPFGEVFLFLTDLAWKSRLTIPMLVTTIFLIMDIRLQIEINIQTGQAAADLDQLDDLDDDDTDDDDTDNYLSDDSSDEDEIYIWNSHMLLNANKTHRSSTLLLTA
ncbi:unnamed protein product [Ceratitis capitata]|uniref:(Mediterranean fruit fly) hypothetical protein n=1 Tax=Ceratitis capitata TaxID=7213 RepID=A0A811U2I5_CERCA|nr:unnamed protein product [Ceratitis capitata]